MVTSPGGGMDSSGSVSAAAVIQARRRKGAIRIGNLMNPSIGRRIHFRNRVVMILLLKRCVGDELGGLREVKLNLKTSVWN